MPNKMSTDFQNALNRLGLSPYKVGQYAEHFSLHWHDSIAGRQAAEELALMLARDLAEKP